MITVFLSILFLNGVISFIYSLTAEAGQASPWGEFIVNFLLFSGISQAGIIFSALMRVVRAGWGAYLSRMGEAITLSSAPLVILGLIILYSGGFPDESFFWRNLLPLLAFYAAGYIYFRSNRRAGYDTPPGRSRSNILPALVIISFVISNTIIAWDFGMEIIPHWDSTIFPPYFWVGNIFAGTSFLTIAALFISGPGRKDFLDAGDLDHTGKLILGYTLLWVYMLFSQYIVIWYGDIPRLTEPLFRQMRGEYGYTFLLMMITAFILPFFTLIRKKVRSDLFSLSIISLGICIGIWLNRYLMIFPALYEGEIDAFFNWTGISLAAAGLSALLLSLKIFLRFQDHALIHGNENGGRHP